MNRRLKKRSITAIVASGVLYGAWAFAANWHVSIARGLLSALTQFCLSAFATSVLTYAMTRILMRGQSLAHRIAAAVVPLNLLALLFAAVHWLAGTPHIVATIAPSYVIGTVFCVAFTLAAVRDLTTDSGQAASRPDRPT